MRDNEPLVMALPKGRILDEARPLLARAGIEPEPEFDDPKSRKLKFRTSNPGLDLISVRVVRRRHLRRLRRAPISASPATTC